MTALGGGESTLRLLWLLAHPWACAPAGPSTAALGSTPLGYSAVLCGTRRYSTIFYGTLWYSMVLYDTLWYSTTTWWLL